LANLAVRFDVGDAHRLLLDAVEAARAYIAGRLAKLSINRRLRG
jgi:hypothetical protein